MSDQSHSAIEADDASAGFDRQSRIIKEVLELKPGETIVVRTNTPGVSEVPVVYIAAGTVRWTLQADPGVQLEKATRATAETATGHRTAETRVLLLRFESDVCWSWVDGKLKDKTEQVSTVPPATGSSVAGSHESPLCAVVADETNTVQLALPEARGAPNGAIYHALLEVGTIDEVMCGDSCRPEQLIPEDCESPP
jgi:hypothetical protein